MSAVIIAYIMGSVCSPRAEDCTFWAVWGHSTVVRHHCYGPALMATGGWPREQVDDDEGGKCRLPRILFSGTRAYWECGDGVVEELRTMTKDLGLSVERASQSSIR
jgi:hypothetical protein